MKDAIRTALRVLFFRATSEELIHLSWRHFAVGIVCTWTVGMGRHWDNPRSESLQSLGAGSVAYVFALAALLWIVAKPLSARPWPYRNLLALVTLTAPPGILYAIPIEWMVDLSTAQTINVLFLIIVSTWRVSLYVFYLRRTDRFSGFRTFIAVLFPIMLIIYALTALNLDHVVFNFMSGVDESAVSSNDAAYSVLFLTTLLTAYFFPVVAIVYFVILAKEHVFEHFQSRPRAENGATNDGQ